MSNKHKIISKKRKALTYMHTFIWLSMLLYIIMSLTACSATALQRLQKSADMLNEGSTSKKTSVPADSSQEPKATEETQGDLQPTADAPAKSLAPTSSPADIEPTASPSPYFTTGDVIIDDTSYKSSDLYVKIINVYEDGVNYYVADCRMKQSDKIFSAFAHDKYGSKDREYPLEMSKNKGAVVAINGDYNSDRTEGYVIRNGSLYRSKPWLDVAAIFKDGTMETYSKNEITAEELLNKGAMQVYSFGPMLLDKNGKALKKFDDPEVFPDNPRTGIGYIEPNHFLLIVVDGRGYGDSKGLDLKEWAKVFEKHGCKRAYNLDGGGSSVMIFMNKTVNHPSDEPQRAQSDIIYIGEKEVDTDNIERFDQ